MSKHQSSARKSSGIGDGDLAGEVGGDGRDDGGGRHDGDGDGDGDGEGDEKSNDRQGGRWKSELRWSMDAPEMIRVKLSAALGAISLGQDRVCNGDDGNVWASRLIGGKL